MKTLYPEIQPFNSFFLDTDSQHAVYVEQSGNPEGIPVIFLHGGPCSGTKPDHRRFFNPQRYHIILFDQRGCGLSLPFGELENNTTQDLCADMERIRTHLDIKQWLVFGGSWGGALALYYAQQHTDKVQGLIIRAVFLARQRDLEWFAKDGVGRIYPEQWQRLIASIPNASHYNLVEDCYEALWSKDEVTQRRVAKEWLAWGAQVALGNDYQPTDEPISEKTLKQARMELHYAKHRYFIDENQLLANCHLLASIPTVIIHGRRDLVCPIEAGLSLHKAMAHADYIILPHAGHIAQGEDMIDALVSATDRFAENHSLLN
ncbi:MAG: prolyl aminopeptidase [Methylococcales bacterium]